jgi:predicted site-specific integrase-resolvase
MNHKTEAVTPCKIAEGEYVSTGQAAKVLGVSQKRATQLTERGKLPYIDGPNGRLILWEVVLERKRWRDEAKAAAGEAVSDDS